MKIGNIVFTDWKQGKTTSLFRFANNNQGMRIACGIGLYQRESSFDFSTLIIGSHPLSIKLKAIDIKRFCKDHYKSDELDQAKKDIDNFILKMDKLIGFM